jgi:UDP-N-acetylglucosamine 2-epimerase (non-hydrolysing)
MRVIVVAGARPNFIKVAPLLEALTRHPRKDLEVLFVHTGQHYDRAMSAEVFEELGIPAPDINLGVSGGTHAGQTARVMIAFEQTCLDWKPDWVVVVGDVNSTLACALAAKKLGIGVAHVEAGLRSKDMTMPEEINRLCTDAISDLLFTTDRQADENLQREGVAAERIHFVGNTMIDTLRKHLGRARAAPLPKGMREQNYAVATLHRPGNVDAPETLRALFGTLVELSRRIPIVFPVHPRTRHNLDEFGVLEQWRGQAGGIRLLEPMTYVPFLGLVARSRFVLTDSGGLQEETTALGIPCLTMRANTERPITCDIGTNILTGTDPRRILDAVNAVLNGQQRKGSIPEKWDGKAAERIVEILVGRG